MSAISKNSPYRAPNWRWQRGTRIFNGESTLSRDHDDEFVRLAGKFQLALQNFAGKERRYLLEDRHPGIFAAWEAYNNELYNSTRRELEARLLANEDAKSIAYKTSMLPETVVYYEAWFFNVKDRLNAKSYILTHVLGASSRVGTSERDHDLLWKLYGYLMGPAMVDALVYRDQQSISAMHSVIADDIRAQLQVKAGLAMRTIPVGSNQQSILDNYYRCLEVEKETGHVGGNDGVLLMLQNLMESVPWRSAMEAGDTDALPPKVREIMEQGVVLRADELMRLSAGEMPASLDDLSHLRFPEKNG